MTKVITRYFETETRAYEVERELLSKRFPRNILRVYTQVEGLADTLTDANVTPETAEAYAWRVASGGAVVMVRAGIKPLGVAKTAREVMAEMGAADLGNLTEEVFVKDDPTSRTSVLSDHPLFLTRVKDPSRTNFYMADWPIPLISRRKPNTDSLIPRHARMANWPIPLIARIKPRDEFAFPRHARMADILLPLTIRREPSDNFVFPRHARMANWPIPLISKRKPYTGSLIGRHTRMANWPFPHLINGKTGSNSLMPGGPRMAAFPLDLLSDRKPSDKFAFPRHARMADLILPLISRRKPFTGSIFPKHARMADILLPLVLKPKPSSKDDNRPWFSRMLGLPTLVRR
ncbi:PucR family transcriptional regulator [Thalassococcus sp. S3]|uniref:PucR family transcriptional regulator n=1 Tax=Thalassococcus sp. S3 TaxID=2017482 RepID=UPI0010247759|nr:PucR family transcriptional regulator [Thalassococcus sp. S3]QBF30253.1 PucR family transcriptional regulator [Thalassococcus sp. S3]